MATPWSPSLDKTWQTLKAVWAPVADLKDAPFVSPFDRSHLEKELGSLSEKNSCLPEDDLAARDFLAGRKSKALVFDQLPEPFMGRPFFERRGQRYAVPIVTLCINPRLDLIHQRDTRTDAAIRANLNGSAECFFFLRPSLAAKKWWRTKFSRVAKEIAKQRFEGSVEHAFHWLAGAPLFNLESFGYRSKSARGTFADLPSVAAAHRMAELLAQHTDALFVVLCGGATKVLDRFALDHCRERLTKEDRLLGSDRQFQGWKPTGKDAKRIADALLQCEDLG